MPLDIPWLLRRENDDQESSIEPAQSSSAPPNYGKGPIQRPEVVHNHYHSADQPPLTWYQRRRCLWTVILAFGIAIIALAVVLAVVLKLEPWKKGADDSISDRESHRLALTGSGGTSSATSVRPNISADGPVPTTAARGSSVASTPASSSSSSSSSSSPSSSSSKAVSINRSSRSLHTSPPSVKTSANSTSENGDGVIQILTSFLATYTGKSLTRASPSKSAPSIRPALSSMASASGQSFFSSGTASTDAARATATSVPFTILQASRLASAHVRGTSSEMQRRILVWQDDESYLVATEWSEKGKTHYRLRNRIGKSADEAKTGTPLAAAADDESGIIHVFFLNTENHLAHFFETAPGHWEMGRLAGKDGALVATKQSLLSATWHRGQGDDSVLAVAYEGRESDLKLVRKREPQKGGSWDVVKIQTLVTKPVPGQMDKPCFAVAGDWQYPSGGGQGLLLAVRDDDGMAAWACSVDGGSNSDLGGNCQRADEDFQDSQGSQMRLGPPPRQMIWIRLRDSRGGRGKSVNGYDLSLVGLGEDGRLDESHFGPNVGREDGPGLKMKQAATAISCTDEALLFAHSGDEVYIYRLQEDDDWSWRSEGTVLAPEA